MVAWESQPQAFDGLCNPCSRPSSKYFLKDYQHRYSPITEMIIQVSEFRKRALEGLPELVAELQSITGRFGEEEAAAWKDSLPRLSKAFSAPGFDQLHLYFNGTSALSLEYQLPAASSWCDVVLLGRGNQGPGAVIIELKHWQTQGDYPEATTGLINHLGQPVLHPSDQVRGYVEYCRRFHSAVHGHSATVNGCVLFTQRTNIEAYKLHPNDQLTQEFPCFSYFEADLAAPFPSFIGQTITAPDFEFAQAFERGTYRQDRGFVRQIGEQILHPELSPFVLLDNQRRAFFLCRAQVESALFQQGKAAAKKVIVVEGPPGSGKSVVAAKIWAALATDDKLPEGPIVFTSTSASQNSNWSHLFAQTAANVSGAGVVKKATSYTPISTHTLGKLRKKHGDDFLENAGVWRENLEAIRDLGVPFTEGSKDREYLVSVVDEAHALINPEHVEGRGQFGFVTGLGPQAYHIIRVSQITIFLLDEKQSFRTRENTTVADIRHWATELGAEFFTVSLAGHQFRCAGSKEYVDWVEAVLGGESPETCRILASAWARQNISVLPKLENVIRFPEPELLARVAETLPTYGRNQKSRPLTGTLDFQIFDNPARMETELRSRIADGNSARLLASYARPWKTKPTGRQSNPHALPSSMKDIVVPYEEDGEMKTWAKIWNFVPNNGSDYSVYIQGTEGSKMHTDPLCEVGCPYAVRGFDWDYVGILWFSDLTFNLEGRRWCADPSHIHETGFSTLTSKARKEGDLQGPHNQKLMEAVVQCYRILLTRPIRGVYLWFEDSSTREFVESSL